MAPTGKNWCCGTTLLPCPHAFSRVKIKTTFVFVAFKESLWLKVSTVTATAYCYSLFWQILLIHVDKKNKLASRPNGAVRFPPSGAFRFSSQTALKLTQPADEWCNTHTNTPFWTCAVSSGSLIWFNFHSQEAVLHAIVTPPLLFFVFLLQGIHGPYPFGQS